MKQRFTEHQTPSNHNVRPASCPVHISYLGIPNLMCGCILGWRSVAYHFRVTVTLTSDLVFQSVVRNIRREEVVLARLRLGHTRVTHSYLLQGEEHPQCVGCDAPFTVRHFLLECGDFAQVRNNCFHVDNMKELFQDIHIDSIMTFLRQINLFNKI